MKFDYDIIIVGGGHAGCEAAAAAARLGSRTLLITSDMTKLAQMSCNPAVGGVAKGQIVREIDALGGQMGIVTDLSTIQFRMLNRSKGPAMWSPRAQCGKEEFSARWRRILENERNLYIWQDTVTALLTEYSENALRAAGVCTSLGAKFKARAVVLTAGTFLGGRIFVGRNSVPGGRAGEGAVGGLTEQLTGLGFSTGRMKTGTPARLDARTLDFEAFQQQHGDANPGKFSFSQETAPVRYQLPCFIVHTNEQVHDILRQGFKDSPLFTGAITGIGPRYCPSIEDKLRTFADKASHQLFLEPEGENTNEYYLNGFSSSLPLEIQVAALKKIPGFGDVQLYRPGYAIEYDYFPPTQLYHTLETKLVNNLWFAGQINGTTGYEEAAAQGLMAGINATLKLSGRDPLILARDEAYIGVLIDDLVTKGVDEPYRMFTSRAEYRILLRQDNADLRLSPIGEKTGLLDKKRTTAFNRKKSLLEGLLEFLHRNSASPDEISGYLVGIGTAPITQGRRLYDLLSRNGVTMDGLQENIPSLKTYIQSNDITPDIIEEAEIQIKYKGYIERERFIAEKLHRLENIRLRPDFDYDSLRSLTIEARQKLSKIRPSTIGQASRIPGVSPADINVLLIHFGR